MVALKHRSLSMEDAERVYRSYPDLKAGTCPTCHGDGSYVWRGERRDCDCEQQIHLCKHYAAAGIGLPFQRLDWDDYAGGDTEVIPSMHHYLTEGQRYIDAGIGLILHGGLGTGKTMLAMLGLKHMVRKGVVCYATTFANTVEAFTSTWGDRDQKRWFAEKFMYSQVLVLDDLGRENRSNVALPQSTFDMILRTRVLDGRPTILTSNLNPKQMETGYGGGVLSLLRGSSMVLEVKGKDYRPSAADRTLSEVAAREVRPIV